jgi:hypothetical protein
MAALDLPHDSPPTMSIDYDHPLFRLFLHERYPLIHAALNSRQPEYSLPDGVSQQPMFYPPSQLLYEPTSPGVSTPSFETIPMPMPPNSHQVSLSPRSSVWLQSAVTSPLGLPIALDATEQNTFESDLMNILLCDDTPDASSETKSRYTGQAISPGRNQQLIMAQESAQSNQNLSRDWTRRRKTIKGSSGYQDSNSDSSRYRRITIYPTSGILTLFSNLVYQRHPLLPILPRIKLASIRTYLVMYRTVHSAARLVRGNLQGREIVIDTSALSTRARVGIDALRASKGL